MSTSLPDIDIDVDGDIDEKDNRHRGTPPYLDIYFRKELWEEPVRIRPWRHQTEPLTTSLTHSFHTKQLIAWLAAYHQAHSWQLRDAMGISSYTLSRITKPLYLAKLISRGRVNPFGKGAVPYIFSLSNSAELRTWVRGLGYDDWLGVTGGTKLANSSNHYRHNLLVGELALSAARLLTPVQLVLGEPFAAASRMVPGCKSGAIGDAVLVTDQGLRIVIELVSNIASNMDDKIARWGRLLASQENSQLGLVVVLLNAAPPHRKRSVGRHLRHLLRSSLAPDKLASAHQGGYFSDREVARARSGILVADWEHWFKVGGGATLGFYQLSADYSPDGEQLLTTSVLNWPFSPPRPGIFAGPAHNIDRLYSVPQAQRVALLSNRT